MIFIALLAAVLIVYLIQYNVYKKHALEDMTYTVSLSAEEVFEGEDIFMFEEISNRKQLPLPYVKVDTELPDGLRFRMIDPNERTSSRRDKMTGSIQSVFVMKGNQKIRRRWRVACQTRGVYHPGRVMLVANDIVGFNPQSRSFEVAPTKYNTVVVLPKAIDLEKHFTTSLFFSGDMVLNRSLLSDPLRKCGTRDYTSADPMSKINWKSTAAHGRLMVNVEEYTQRYQFNIIMNMQSRDIEKNVSEPSMRAFVEMTITVAASILDGVSTENIPVRFFCNTPPETIDASLAVSEDETGSQIFMSPIYSGKRDMINALRMLAMLQLRVSVPMERVLDHILANPHFYASGGNLILISPYLSERMLHFNEEMGRLGVKVIFFITTTNRNALVIPRDADVYFKTDIPS